MTVSEWFAFGFAGVAAVWGSAFLVGLAAAFVRRIRDVA